ncbi:cell division protein FtsL [Streptohalobacillus salinus]|uniref:Cell division protein FtsL n=1 Tax=Streptohalobacillus salinus TaxID=621096 RepID=A0A2V3WEN3_9BACI|nr:cell division protein FtsL [Streptohalobacillus salinus]PXW92615.1 cell division protein FtsL [Streptohalobacillus salinus]
MMSINHARSYQPTAPKRQQSKQVKVVVKSKKYTTGEYVLWGAYAAMFAVALFLLVHMSSNVDQLNRNIESLKGDVSEQTTLNENLTYQKMEYSNPERILAIAKENGLDIQNTKVKQATTIE